MPGGFLAGRVKTPCLRSSPGRSDVMLSRYSQVYSSMARIFLIDDDPLILEMLSDTLRGAGHEVSTARNGWEALKEFRPDWHELVITDVMMPYVDGADMLQILRRETPRTPVIVVSGQVGAQGGGSADALLERGARCVLKKPVSPAELLDAVAQVLPAAH